MGATGMGTPNVGTGTPPKAILDVGGGRGASAEAPESVHSLSSARSGRGICLRARPTRSGRSPVTLASPSSIQACQAVSAEAVGSVETASVGTETASAASGTISPHLVMTSCPLGAQAFSASFIESPLRAEASAESVYHPSQSLTPLTTGIVPSSPREVEPGPKPGGQPGGMQPRPRAGVHPERNIRQNLGVGRTISRLRSKISELGRPSQVSENSPDFSGQQHLSQQQHFGQHLGQHLGHPDRITSLSLRQHKLEGLRRKLGEVERSVQVIYHRYQMNHGGRTPPNESELREVTTLTAQRRSILAAIKQIEESSS